MRTQWIAILPMPCGCVALTALEAGMIERTDDEHLAFATSNDRVLYSYNVGDFARLHGSWRTRGERHAGIILARQQHLSLGEQMRRILRLSASRSAEQMENSVEFLGSW